MGNNNNNPSGNAFDEALASLASIGRAQGLSADSFLAAARDAYAQSAAATDYTLRFRSVAVRATDVPKIQKIARQRVGEALSDVEELVEACALLMSPDGDEELADITTGTLFKASAARG
jgi:hypothetical protein